jgi:hypothetical protein
MVEEEEVGLVFGGEINDTLAIISRLHCIGLRRGLFDNAVPWTGGGWEDGALALGEPVTTGGPVIMSDDSRQGELGLLHVGAVRGGADGEGNRTRRDSGGAVGSGDDGHAARSGASAFRGGMGELRADAPPMEARNCVADRVAR